MKLPFVHLALALLPAVAVFAQPPTAADSDRDSDQAALTQGDNAFAVGLYAQLRAQPGNLFFSPASISTAFGMAYAGARGETASQIASVFHFTLSPEQLHPAMGKLLAAMNPKSASYQLNVADALWAQRGQSFLPEYLKVVQSSYGAGFQPIDFRAGPDAARATINHWIEKQTNNKIQDLLAPGAVTPTTRLVITNAIYFKGDWLDAFDKKATEDADFHLSASQTVKAPLMHETGGFAYFDGGAFQALELAYKGGALAMVVLLPKDVDGLPALEQSLTAAALSEWTGKLAPVDKVVVTLPRFAMTRAFELNDALAAMGMAQAFTGAADFSGMTGRRDFTISAAIHKAFIDVNETGTEAAAATSIVMRATAMRYEPPPVVFRADHPFLFLIRDTRSGAILFLGRVADPTK
jgi:serpin B